MSDTTGDVTGWIDIVNLTTAIVLSTAFDRRLYEGTMPSMEQEQREFILLRFKEWKQHFIRQFDGTKENGDKVNWEEDMFRVGVSNYTHSTHPYELEHSPQLCTLQATLFDIINALGTRRTKTDNTAETTFSSKPTRRSFKTPKRS